MGGNGTRDAAAWPGLGGEDDGYALGREQRGVGGRKQERIRPRGEARPSRHAATITWRSNVRLWTAQGPGRDGAGVSRAELDSDADRCLLLMFDAAVA